MTTTTFLPRIIFPSLSFGAGSGPIASSRQLVQPTSSALVLWIELQRGLEMLDSFGGVPLLSNMIATL